MALWQFSLGALLLSLTSPLVWGVVYDPEIRTLRVGHVLDVRPAVSSDGKYLTLGEARIQASTLDSIFVEEIRTLTVLGARSFSPRRTSILPGA